MKKITQFFSKLNQKNNAREVKEINNTDYSGSEAALVDNDAGILGITEALDKNILSITLTHLLPFKMRKFT